MQLNTKHEMRSSWPAWADFLQQRGLMGFASWLIEAASPLTILGAQAFHFGAPFLRPVVPEDQLNAMSFLLEDRDEGQAFVNFLRERGTA
jgi:hypothetical protein